MSVAKVVGLWRYPVKSMGGESCTSTGVDERGLLGDRAYALVDTESGKIASAKNPRLWGRLLTCAARYAEPPGLNGHAARVEMELPDGSRLFGDDADLERHLSTVLGRAIRFSSTAPRRPVLEEYWPDIEDLANRDALTDEAMPSETFFDCAKVHLLTTNTLAALRAAEPASSFGVDRFRPNILLEAPGEERAYAEDAWVGANVRIGADVVLRITGPAPRCVMTTLARPGWNADLGVLRAAAKHHGANVGVYADVVRSGTIALGDSLAVVP
ncbi:MAG TPA: MOSC N-terminal beta barrel domain-containing protein [Candidatus Limnocylindria bacterium]|jgi:uncharacterized protein YcbX|nr:MOSC N-terminal beta barrel domain-containing protein [Candidatus Limnocylindria bacterium]